MFDIGFFELLIIAIVALLVIGPERLPELLRTLGLWMGRLQRGFRQARSEFERHIGADDIRRQLHNEEVMQSLEACREEINDLVNRGQSTYDSADSKARHNALPEPPKALDNCHQPVADTVDEVDAVDKRA